MIIPAPLIFLFKDSSCAFKSSIRIAISTNFGLELLIPLSTFVPYLSARGTEFLNITFQIYSREAIKKSVSIRWPLWNGYGFFYAHEGRKDILQRCGGGHPTP